MRAATRLMTAAAVVVTATTASVLTGSGTSAADGVKDGRGGGTFVPFSQTLRRCDFSETDFNGPTGFARPSAVIRTDGASVTADVEIATAIPNIRYDVRLIQMPRPSSANCNGGDPGVAAGTLFTDGAGFATTTVHGALAPGATGVWAFVSRPDAFSQNPAEFYTSDLVVKV